MNGSNLIANCYKQKQIILQKVIDNFSSSISLTPKIGIELEFYLLNQDSKTSTSLTITQNYILQLQQNLQHEASIYMIEKEQGASQIEIKFSYESNLTALCHSVERVKMIVQEIAQKNNLYASFAAQPFEDDCGSALQFNFSLHDENDKNLFEKKHESFFYSIDGMLDSIDSAMVFYAPHQDDYLRFDLARNIALYKKGKFSAPVNISFGEDNRTAAIRTLTNKNSNNRIEFRVAASDADPYLSIASLLIFIENSISKKKYPQNSIKIFGNAFDLQYTLKPFAASLEEAEENFLQNYNYFLKNG